MPHADPAPGVSMADVLDLLATQRALLREGSAARAARCTCEAVRRLVGAEGATFVLREGEQVHYAEEDAVAPLWKGRRFSVHACISGWAALHAETAVVEDIAADPRIPVEAYRPTFVRSLAMAPIGRDGPVGALGAYWGTPRRVTPREVWLLEQLADVAAARFEGSPEAEAPTPTDGATSSRLMAVIAHDLRQPLTTIATVTELLKARGEGSAELLARIERGAAEASRMVEQLLEDARLRAGALPLALEHVDVARLCRALAEEMGARVEACPAEAVGLCDPDRLRQVIANLVRNALEHGDGSPPSVRVERDGDGCRITVHNHGPRIPDEVQEGLFLPFRRRATGGPGGSVGLGLYIADGIARAHGGRIEVRSCETEGTAFSVRLPLSPTMLADRSAPAAQKAASAPHDGPRSDLDLRAS